MRSKAWLAARVTVSLWLARLPCTASSAQRSRRLRSTRAAAPVLLAHADVTIFSICPKLRFPPVLRRDSPQRDLPNACVSLPGSSALCQCHCAHAAAFGFHHNITCDTCLILLAEAQHKAASQAYLTAAPSLHPQPCFEM